LARAAVRHEAPRTPPTDLEALRRRGRPGPVDHLGDHGIDRHRFRVGQRFAALQSGQLQQFDDQPAEPVGLVPDPLGEAAGGLRVRALFIVHRVGERLGQELEGADGGLQLVAHVGDEVATHPAQPMRLGNVECLDRHVAAVEGNGPDMYAERLDVAPTGHVEFHLAAGPSPSSLTGQRTDDGVRDRGSAGNARSDQAHLVSGRVDEHRPVLAVQHEHADSQCVEAAPTQPLAATRPLHAVIVGPAFTR
jgi:hypothetical protein